MARNKGKKRAKPNVRTAPPEGDEKEKSTADKELGEIPAGRADTPDRSLVGKLANGKTVAGFLLLFFILAATSISRKSATFDEMAHLTAGYHYWYYNDYRLNPENGNLPQRWVALPLILFGDYTYPSGNDPLWKQADVWIAGRAFFHSMGNDLKEMLFRGRLAMIILAVILNLIIYQWSRELFGIVGGFVSLVLATFSPTLLAHSRLTTSDMMLTLFFIVTLRYVWLALHTITWRTLIISPLAMAGLFVSKMSSVLIVPIALFLALIRLIAGRPLEIRLGLFSERLKRLPKSAVVAAVILIHIIVSYTIIWGAYGFRYSGINSARIAVGGYQSAFSTLLEGSGFVGAVIDFFNEYRLLPEAFLQGFAVVASSTQARNAFLNGEFSYTGWPHFFPFCLLVKTPLPFFVILILALAAVFVKIRTTSSGGERSIAAVLGNGIYRTLPLWTFLIVYWTVSIRSHLNIGHRHILPTYPVMLIFAGAAGYWCERRGVLLRLVIGGLIGFFIFESFRYRPHYLSYFNQLAGGPAKANAHLVDSSLDWGQDLPGLADWLERNITNNESVYISYFGSDSPEYYGIDAYRLPGFLDSPSRSREFDSFKPGIYCISASMLSSAYSDHKPPWTQGHDALFHGIREKLEFDVTAGRRARSRAVRVHGERGMESRLDQYDQLRFARLCQFLRNRIPDASIGYSILIHRLSEVEIRRILFEPFEGLPATQSALNARGVFLDLGNMEGDRGDSEQAIMYYRKSLDIDPGYPSALKNLSMSLLRLERFEDAVDLLNRLVKLRPDSPEHYINLMACYLKLSDVANAKRIADVAVERFPDHRAVKVNVAIIAERLGKH